MPPTERPVGNVVQQTPLISLGLIRFVEVKNVESFTFVSVRDLDPGRL